MSTAFSPAGNNGFTTAGRPVIANYQRRLDVHQGLHTVAFRRGAESFTREAFASRRDDVMAFRYTAAGSARLSGRITLNSGQYFALDLDTGKVLWRSEPRQANHAAIARSGNTIFSLEDDSELVIVRLNREKFDAVARYKVAASDTWTQPVISGNRIFVKDVSTLTLWTLE